MKRTNHSAESGNALVVVLVALLVAAVGGLAYTSSQLMEKEGGDTKAAPAAQQAAAAGQAAQQPAAPQIEIKPGNPVVAKVGGQEITRLDVFNFMQTLPANTRQLPIAQLFPVVQDQVVNTRLLQEKSKGAKLDNDPLVKERIQAAKDQIVPVVFMQREVEKALTEDRLKTAYEAYRSGFPEVQEVNAKHILVEDEKLAAKLIKDLDGGASFEELAKENSTDPTAEKGGDLGYFTKRDVVPEFAEVAFSVEPGSYSKEPVKTQFGFHVIKVEEKRKRPPASFEDAKPFLEGQLRQIIAAEIVQGWRADAGIELFDINGDDIEPAAGEEAQ